MRDRLVPPPMALVELPFLEVVDAASRLARRARLSILDSAMPHEKLGRWSYCACDPIGVFRVEEGRATWDGVPVDAPPLEALRNLLARHARPREPGGPPFQGGAIGAFSYEAGHLFERLPVLARAPRAVPQIDLAFYDSVLAIDVIDRRAVVASSTDAGARAMVAKLRAPQVRPGRLPSLDWTDEIDQASYEAKVARVIAYIRDGDIFQANLSHRFSARPSGSLDPLAVHLALRLANPAPFAALLVDGSRFIASSSPERFLRLQGETVEARPIKGTARRAAFPRLDFAIAAALAESEKDRAENVMIVDLLRNDLSRVCEPGSVAVPDLCAIESYASVHHLTSSIVGRLKPGRDMLDLVAATFPGGSITGAPKIRAMEIIAELEGRPRGIYCGSLGWIGFDGDADLNIAIRTVSFDGETLTVGAGGGITLLSDPRAEYEETIAKAERILQALDTSNNVAWPDEAA
jgi:para-aminobenzoate synthetase component 1